MHSGTGVGSPLRRVLSASAAELFAVACSVTRNPVEAVAAVHAGAAAAVAAAPSGRPTRAEVFASVVSEAVARSAKPAVLPAFFTLGEHLDTNSVGELTALADELSVALEPLDRALLELTLRQGIDGAELAAILDRSPGTMSADVQGARERAEQLIGSALFARVGRDDCAALATALADLPPDPDAADVAGRVQAHLETCESCADRRRALVPVTTLLANRPVPTAPPQLLRPVEPPPPRRARPWVRWRRGAVVAVGALAAGLLAGGLLAAATRPDRPRTAPGTTGALHASATVLTFAPGPGAPSTAQFALRNTAGRETGYRIRSSAPWVHVTPAAGRLAAGETATVSVTVDHSTAPEGRDRADVRVASAVGSAVIVVNATVERPPAIGALSLSPASIVAATCSAPMKATVTAPVAEESGLASAFLHWRAPAARKESAAPMTLDRDTAKGTLGPFPAGTVQWWVTATDSRGNSATSPPQDLVVSAC